MTFDPFTELYETLDADARYQLDERAAIHEFDGGSAREEAEKMALREFMRRKP